MPKNIFPDRQCGSFWLLSIIALMLVLAVGTLVVMDLHPSFAAEGMDVLRGVFGDQAVSSLEMAILNIQDEFNHWRYTMGFANPAAPWQVSFPLSQTATPANAPGSSAVASTNPSLTLTPDLRARATALTTEPPAWKPADVTPLGTLQEEGVWAPYITAANGQTVSFRTFIQPDPQRPYAIVGIVAFDLTQTRLHYVLGTAEPFSPDSPPRTGRIPDVDRAPGVLLAMFNGGFKARHGRFGAMANGITALPPRLDLGTLAIYQDGSVRLGAWGSEIILSTRMTAFRQNGPLVVYQGKINPRIYSNSPADWGYTVNDVSPTWRSGLALSADGRTLYYLCGSDLSMEMLAKSMLAINGVANGVQLDINTYWVHFVVVRPVGNRLNLESLFPDMMRENIDRYLQSYSRDYFYLTMIH